MTAASIAVEKEWRRRCQAAAVAKYMCIFLVLPFVSLGILGYIICCSPFWPLGVAYLVWLYVDWNIGESGSRPSSWYRGWTLWKHMAEYFPLDLVKTVDLPTDKNYMFCCHPHGLLGVAPFVNFCTDGSGFSQKFPGIQTYTASLASQFYYPFRREIVAALGVITASAKSITTILQKPTGGNAVALVVGGAEEALYSHKGNYSLCIQKRKGFVKLAMINGASLVPVYSFGETETFKQLDNSPGTRLRRFQQVFKRRVGVSPVLFYGTGLFGNKFGIMPFRNRLVTVVGSPLHLEPNFNPTAEDVDKVHAEYVSRLEQLFEEHKHRYGIPADAHLVLD